ncbi:hypothetical protein THRCLA_22870 [Thraustotheca clavata]|uniref:Protein kinase domain-containing protein n=1 Tax=Thraustotheca clavata TaxID=74557 RepID=A0A1V9YRL6_9STRA|nr:hypothetical protein THRCLA_22870 [Thraustotheca clavata]
MGQFLWRFKLQCARNIMAGVQYLHHQNVIYYNLSSIAVLIDPGASYSIKLVDSGYSKLAKANETLTLGTGGCRWSAPECHSDIFAFGVLLSELETHQVSFCEFEHDTVAQKKIANGCLPSFTSSCPTWYIEPARKCLDFGPLKRPTISYIILP